MRKVSTPHTVLAPPEGRGEQREDREDLQPTEEHADRENYAAEGVDDLEALRGPDLIQPRSDVVEGRRDRARRGGERQVILERHQERREAEDDDPGGEEPEYGDPDALG